MSTTHIVIDMDQKCAECRKGGAAPSGLCLRCTDKAMAGKPMKSATGRAKQKQIKEMFARAKK